MTYFLDLLVVFSGVVWTTVALRYLMKGKMNSLMIIMMAFQIFCVVPVFLDLVFGQPSYSAQPGFYKASRDEATHIVYNFYILFIPIFWWALKGKNYHETVKTLNVTFFKKKNWQYLLVFLAIFPVFLIWLAPAPGIYLTYAASIRIELSPNSMSFHNYFSKSCVISLFAIAVLIISNRASLIKSIVLYLPFLSADIWFHGKRSIVAIAALLLLSILFYKGQLKKGRFLLIVPVVLFFFASFSNSYQSSVRNIGTMTQRASSTAVYDNFRIDFGRDDVIKMTIYKELNPVQNQILEYRGESILFYLTILVPRSVWPNKPLPYAQYFTSAMFNIKPQMMGWGMTTSWLEEAIANFGMAGFILGPLLFVFIAKFGDSSNNAIVKFVTVYIGIMFLTLHLVAFFIPFVIWIIITLLARKANKRRKIVHSR